VKESAITATLEFDNLSLLPLLYGEHNANITYLEKILGIRIADRGNTLVLSGDDKQVGLADHVLSVLWERLQKRPDTHIGPADIDAVVHFSDSPSTETSHKEDKKKPMAYDPAASSALAPAPVTNLNPALEDANAIHTKRRSLVPRTKNQAAYVEHLRKKEMVFGIGPAGTGKTYLAVAVGVEMYEKQMIERLVFCRPAVEAGEKLGFLPGDMREKIDPYLRPIYDALYDFLGAERVEKMLERGEIEIAPLAFMRGRTLSHAYVVLDEAQNTTSGQMKMFLSRMGEGSRMVITGDPSQNDLPDKQISGLKEASNILTGIDEIGFVEFTNADVVRHKLVGKILNAYDAKK
jgi:phosphate starvation-inducible PhoH-like protein